MSEQQTGGKVAKTWKYVLNNPLKKDIDQLKLFDCKRHRCCLEVGESGTPHLQGAITFTRGYRLTQLKKLNEKIHWAIAIVNDFNYETKGESVIEIDNREQGTRTDLKEVAKELIEGKSIKEVSLIYPGTFIKYHKGIEKFHDLHSDERNWEMKVHIRWGKSGTGKTRYVYDNYKSIYPKPVGKWWDFYDGQEVVLIDDFDPEHSHDMVFDYWLRLLDRYPMTVELKGSSRQFNSKIIYITSNFNPKSWFIGRKNRDAFFRRVTDVTEVVNR